MGIISRPIGIGTPLAGRPSHRVTALARYATHAAPLIVSAGGVRNQRFGICLRAARVTYGGTSRLSACRSQSRRPLLRQGYGPLALEDFGVARRAKTGSSLLNWDGACSLDAHRPPVTISHRVLDRASAFGRLARAHPQTAGHARRTQLTAPYLSIRCAACQNGESGRWPDHGLTRRPPKRTLCRT